MGDQFSGPDPRLTGFLGILIIFVLVIVVCLNADFRYTIAVFKMDQLPTESNVGGMPGGMPVPLSNVVPSAKPSGLHVDDKRNQTVIPKVFPRDSLVYRLEVVKTYKHDHRAYTQGLIYIGDNTFYESTGIYGESNVRKVDLTTGLPKQQTRNKAADFGEGLAYYRGFFWQLLWRTRKLYQYDPVTLRVLHHYTMPQEFQFNDGWGLASSSDGIDRLYSPGSIPANERLYVTDSGTKLYEVTFDGNRFKLLKQVTITTLQHKPLEMANELELIDESELWANVYQKDCIARLDPRTGKIFGWLLGGHLRQHNLGARAEVFNGIAYDRKGGRIFVTGKLWNKMFLVKLVPVKMSIPQVEKMCVPRFNVFHR